VSAGNTPREGVQVCFGFGTLFVSKEGDGHVSFSSLVLSLCRGTRRERPCMVVRGC